MAAVTDDNGHFYIEYDLDATLSSGQTFAFRKGENGGYSGIADGRPVEVDYRDNRYYVTCRARDQEYFQKYFNLDCSYKSLLGKYLNFAAPNDGGVTKYRDGLLFLSKCVDAFGGLRLLKQPVWETICAFILSANNHQKRIESLYANLSLNFGERVEWDGRVYHAFPAPERLASAGEGDLRGLGLGYRAPYISETSRRIATEGLPDFDAMEYSKALKHLTGYKGVGEKVADCVLLFSTKHGRAFPVDVWIERAMRELFGMEGSRHMIKREAQDFFEEAAGVAQQFIFHGMRRHV